MEATSVSIDRGMEKEYVRYIYISIYIYTHIYTYTHTHTHTHTRILLSHKREWNNAICSNMAGPSDLHAKWSKPKTNIIWYGLYVESKKKKDTNELIHKIEIDPQT